MLSKQEHQNKKSKTVLFKQAVTDYKAVLGTHNLSFSVDLNQLSDEFKTLQFIELMAGSNSTKIQYSQAFTDEAKLELINRTISLTGNPKFKEVTDALAEVKKEFKVLKDKGLYSSSLDVLYNEFALDIDKFLDDQLIVIDPVAMAAFEDIVKAANKIVNFLDANGGTMSGYSNHLAVWDFMQEVCSADIENVSAMRSKITGYKVNEHRCQFLAKKYDMRKYKK